MKFEKKSSLTPRQINLSSLLDLGIKIRMVNEITNYFNRHMVKDSKKIENYFNRPIKKR
jgi:hypothetical protein